MKQDIIEKYDKQNGTELARFVAYLERGKTLQHNESRYFYVANAGKLLSKYGIKGIITTSTQTVNRRHSKDIDHLTIDEWVDTIISINNPTAITLYGDDKKSYRIYTVVVKNAKNICVGIDMKNMGHHVEIAKVKTAFARDVANAFNEILLFPSRSVLKKALEESSAAHNSQLYPQEPVAKIQQFFKRAADFLKNFKIRR